MSPMTLVSRGLVTRMKECKTVPAATLLCTQHSRLDSGACIRKWFPGVAPLQPTTLSRDDGSNAEDTFHTLCEVTIPRTLTFKMIHKLIFRCECVWIHVGNLESLVGFSKGQCYVQFCFISTCSPLVITSEYPSSASTVMLTIHCFTLACPQVTQGVLDIMSWMTKWTACTTSRTKLIFRWS